MQTFNSSHLIASEASQVQASPLPNPAPVDPSLRILEIESELAEMKRRYIVDGVSGDLRRRATLEAECAALSLTRYHKRVDEATQKALAQEEKTKSFLFLLCEKVEAAGLGRLIQEAKDESLEHIKNAGLFDAYSSKARTRLATPIKE